MSYEIADSEEEFLAIIQELNEWVEGNENENRSIFITLDVEHVESHTM